MKTIHFSTPSMKGNIFIGNDVVSTRLPNLTKGQQNFVITDTNVYALYRQWFETYFSFAEIFVLPSGEENKNLNSLFRILGKMAGAGLRRNAKLFAVGGGVVGDIGGLAASLYMRGIAYVQIPTTLLAQVDSSVGGKTAVDLEGIKNIIGAFYQPTEVLIDPTFLNTLPIRETQCGWGEIVKYCALSGEIMDKVENNIGKLDNCLESLIYDCVAYKAKVVQADEKELGERRGLNVGHTTGHVIELAYGLSHGLSVLYGMLFETRIAMQAGICEKGYGEKLIAIVKKIIGEDTFDFSGIAQFANKAKLDKKNFADGEIVMSVAKSKGEWTTLSMPFEEYQRALEALVES